MNKYTPKQKAILNNKEDIIGFHEKSAEQQLSLASLEKSNLERYKNKFRSANELYDVFQENLGKTPGDGNAKTIFKEFSKLIYGISHSYEPKKIHESDNNASRKLYDAFIAQNENIKKMHSKEDYPNDLDRTIAESHRTNDIHYRLSDLEQVIEERLGKKITGFIE